MTIIFQGKELTNIATLGEADQIDDMVDVQTGEQCAEREVTAESRICNRRRLRCSKADLAPKVYSNESKTK